VFSIVGRALATSVHDCLYFTVLAFILNKRYGFNAFSAKKIRILGIFLGAALTGLTFFVVKQIFPLSEVSSKLHMLLQLSMYLAAGVGVFLVSLRLLFKVNILEFIKGKNG
jgi:peptidoglycan biosynthesis protein MviN/MurJ (putative lipid II flippase)